MKRLKIRFSIKTMLFLTAAVTVAVVVYGRFEARASALNLLDYDRAYSHGVRKVEFCKPEDSPIGLRLLAIFLPDHLCLPADQACVGDVYSRWPEAFDAVATLTELKKLRLWNQVEPHDHSALSSLRNLKELYFTDCGWIVDSSFIGELSSLEHFYFCDGIIEDDLASLGRCQNLKFIYMSGVNLEITDESFDKICNASNLESLELKNSYYLGPVRDFHPVLKLKKLKKLTGVLDPSNPLHHEIIDQLPDDCVVEF